MSTRHLTLCSLFPRTNVAQVSWGFQIGGNKALRGPVSPPSFSSSSLKCPVVAYCAAHLGCAVTLSSLSASSIYFWPETEFHHPLPCFVHPRMDGTCPQDAWDFRGVAYNRSATLGDRIGCGQYHVGVTGSYPRLAIIRVEEPRQQGVVMPDSKSDRSLMPTLGVLCATTRGWQRRHRRGLKSRC
ncbi:hypothetical protein VTI74DRAFT_3032 [Chaetomium olivicolor]